MRPTILATITVLRNILMFIAAIAIRSENTDHIKSAQFRVTLTT